MLDGNRFLELGQGLPDSLHRGGRGVGLGGRWIENRQGQSRAGWGELERDMILRRSGAMFGGQGELGALAAQVEIGVAPAMEFTGAAQGLAPLPLN